MRRGGGGIDSHFLRRGGGRRNTAVLVLPQEPGKHHQAPRRKLARWRPQALWGGRVIYACLPACLPDGASLQAFMFEARGPLKPRNDRPVPQPALPVAVARSSLTLLTQRKLSVGPFRTLATCRGSSPEMGRWSPRCIRPPSESTVEKGRPPSGRRRPNPSIPPIDTGDFVLSPRGHGIQSSVFRLTDAFPSGVAWWSTPKKSAAHGRGELPSPTILDGGCSLENAVAQEPCLSASTLLF